MNIRSTRPRASSRAAGRPTISRRRLWLFRSAALVFPLVLILLLELALRAFGYGVPSTYTVQQQIAGETVVVGNPFFTWQFFGPRLARSGAPFALTPKKSPGTCRIFVLGGSAAQGFPEPAFGMARVLETMLREQYPGVEFEITNTGIMAINSHVVLPIAEECSGLDADVMVVYLGNNEVVGPYGAGSVFAPLAGSRSVLDASRAISSTRLGQLLGRWSGKFSSGDDMPKVWRGMEMFLKQQVRASDAALAATYEHFEANLQDICQAGEDAGVPVILGTVAVNLKDCPPFASLHRPGLSEEDRREWDRAYQQGVRWETTGELAKAIEHYKAAAAIDDQYAELFFRLARCHWKQEKYEDARQLYAKARDLDTLRFRADSRINAVIRRVAAERAASDVTLADAENAVWQSSPHGVPGHDAFYEHVHLRFAGTFFVARSLCQAVESSLPSWVREHASGRPLLSQEELARRMVYTTVDRYDELGIILALAQRPPFTNQLDHDQQRTALLQERALLRSEIRGQEFDGMIEAYRRSLDTSRVPSERRVRYAFVLLNHAGLPEAAEEQYRLLIRDYSLTREFVAGLGKSLLDQSRVDAAIKTYQDAAAAQPWDENYFLFLIQAYLQQEDFASARDAAERVLEVHPQSAEAYHQLGVIFLLQDRVIDATTSFQQALEIDSKRAESHNNLGTICRRLGRPDDATDHFREALRLDAEYTTAHYNLGNVLSASGRMQEALRHYRGALQINPDYAEAHHSLAFVFQKMKRFEEAATHYREALRIKPDYSEAHVNWGKALQQSGRLEEAVAHYKKAIKLEPGTAQWNFDVAHSLAELGRFAEALSHYNDAVRLSPGHVDAANNLAWLLATCSQAEVRDGKRALSLARPLAESPESVSFAILDTLAAAHAETGNFKQAVQWQEKAVLWAPAPRKAGLRDRLELYKSGRPFRQTVK